MDAGKPPRRTGKVLYAALGLTLVLAALDLGTKAWAVRHLSAEILSPRTVAVCEGDAIGRLEPGRRQTEAHVIVPGSFELRYAENCGAAFGIMRAWPKPLKLSLFLAVVAVAFVWLGSAFIKGSGSRAFAVAIPFVFGGAIGNLVDRLRLGYVVDFIRFYGEMPERLRTSPDVPPYWEYPTFNLADVWIWIGGALLIVEIFLLGRREAAAARKAAESAEAA